MKVFVVGDSHSRAFSNNNNFMPIFIGAGKLHNFINEENSNVTMAKVLSLVKSIDKENPIMFVFGEPDCRYYTGQGWYPWDSRRRASTFNYKRKVKKSIKRYLELVRIISESVSNRLIILNVTPSKRVKQNKIVNYYNLLLREELKSGSVLFLEINKSITDNKSIVKEQYLGDTVHLNNLIQPYVESVLMEKELIEGSTLGSLDPWDHKDILNSYEFNERFGCYTQKK